MSSSVDVNFSNPVNISLGAGITLNTMPVDITSTSTIIGNPAAPVAALLVGDSTKPISTLLLGDPNQPITTTLQGNPAKPISAAIEMLNFPRFTFSEIKDLLTPKLRIRIPNYSQVCFKLLGVELFSICMAGEAQTITEPYIPNAQERCEDPCCQPDTRPFPEPKK